MALPAVDFLFSMRLGGEAVPSRYGLLKDELHGFPEAPNTVGPRDPRLSG